MLSLSSPPLFLHARWWHPGELVRGHQDIVWHSCEFAVAPKGAAMHILGTTNITLFIQNPFQHFKTKLHKYITLQQSTAGEEISCISRDKEFFIWVATIHTMHTSFLFQPSFHARRWCDWTNNGGAGGRSILPIWSNQDASKNELGSIMDEIHHPLTTYSCLTTKKDFFV